jgi:hypothetical protein
MHTLEIETIEAQLIAQTLARLTINPAAPDAVKLCETVGSLLCKVSAILPVEAPQPEAAQPAE